MLLQNQAATSPKGKGGKGGRLANNLYVIPGSSRPASIREAAYHFVGDVLSTIEGGRAKVKDVINDINKAFLEHNPEGWQTLNDQKRAESGGFSVYGLSFLGRLAPPAKPDRWAVQPTFRMEENELVLLREGDDAEMTEASESEAEAQEQGEPEEEDESEEEVSEIDE